MMGDPIFYQDSVHIENSHECLERAIQMTIIRGILQDPKCPECVRRRTETSLLNEWIAHNVLYNLGIQKERTGSVDFDAEPVWRCAIYSLIANSGMILFVVAIAVMIGMASMCSSCSSVREVYVPVHDTIERVRVEQVPVDIHDSVYVSHKEYVYMQGDTVHDIVKDVEIRYKEVPVEVHDTIADKQVVHEPYEVVVTEEKRIRGFFWWSGFVIWLGCFGFSLYKLYGFIRHKMKK